MKPCGLRNALGGLVAPAGQAVLTWTSEKSTHLCSSSCAPGSTTQAGSASTLGKPSHTLGKAFNSILRYQNLGTFIHRCFVCHAMQPCCQYCEWTHNAVEHKIESEQVFSSESRYLSSGHLNRSLGSIDCVSIDCSRAL